MSNGRWVSGEEFDAQFKGSSATGGKKGSCFVKLFGLCVLAFCIGLPIVLCIVM